MIVIYGARSGIIRRMIKAAFPGEDLASHAILAPGEAMLETDGDPWEAVEAALGRKPLKGVCAVVKPDGGLHSTIMADPDIDTHPEGRVVLWE